MKKFLLYIVPIGLAALLLVYFGFLNSNKTQTNNDRHAERLTDASQWGTKINDQFPVTVKVIPIELGGGAQAWKFDVAFDAHSGSLDEDPAEAIILYDDKGGAYQPISWDGAGPGSHHREGVVSFNLIIPSPAYVTLKVKNVGGIPERSFIWGLE